MSFAKSLSKRLQPIPPAKTVGSVSALGLCLLLGGFAMGAAQPGYPVDGPSPKDGASIRGGDTKSAGLKDGEERLSMRTVSRSLLRASGVKPVLGRLFRAGEDRLGSKSTVLLSFECWRSKFGSDPRIVGRSIQLGNRRYEVVGVLPRGFRLLGNGSDIWVPAGLLT